MKKCPHCNKINREEANYCNSCGKTINEPKEVIDAPINKKSLTIKSYTIIMIVIVLIILIGNLVYNGLINRSDQDKNLSVYNNNKNSTNYAQIEEVDNTKILEELIKDFDNAWLGYVNFNSQEIWQYILPGSNIEDSIKSFDSVGIKEEFLDITVKDIKIEGDKAYIRVFEKLSKIKDGTETIRDYNWVYEALKMNDRWLLTDFTKDTEQIQSNVENDVLYTEAYGEKNVPFKSSGVFSGGEITDGQDVGKIRWSKQGGFERIVLDLYEFTYTGPGDPVAVPCYYEVDIVNDEQSVITLSGARGLSADIPDITSSDYISYISKYFPEDDSQVALEIVYKQPVEIRVFELRNPARVVIDIKSKQ